MRCGPLRMGAMIPTSDSASIVRAPPGRAGQVRRARSGHSSRSISTRPGPRIANATSEATATTKATAIICDRVERTSIRLPQCAIPGRVEFLTPNC